MNNALATAAQVASSLVTVSVSRGRLASQERLPDATDRVLHHALLSALPPAARVLQIGGAEEAISPAYLRAHPAAEWVTVSHAAQSEGHFDLIVLPLGLRDHPAPDTLLRQLAHLATAEARLIVGMTNEATLEMLQRCAEADFTDTDHGSLAATNLRYGTPSSAYKLLMDAGWMPHLAHREAATLQSGEVSAAAMALADAFQVPRGTAQRTLATRTLVIEARRCFDAQPRHAGAASFAVVVPTTRERQLRLNVESSPGLQEVGARIVSCRHASSPADALAHSLAEVSEDWVLLCHQDVYFAAGFGEQLQAILAAIPQAERALTLIGFAGMAVNPQTHATEQAGFVIDRLHRFDRPDSRTVVSIDELALVVARDTLHRIDPQFGWHLWATDMCLNAICQHEVFPRIVRLPLFHNSLNDYTLPPSFYASAERLATKYAAFGPIATLCGTIDSALLAPHRPAAKTSPGLVPA